MSFFHQAQNTSIYGGTFIASSGSGILDQERAALDRLERHSSCRAFHNSKHRYDPPKCLPQTREAVFQEIQEWLHGTSAKKPILWIYGPAGAGKSAIAQSVAEKTGEMEYVLVASFFFNRSDGERNTTEHLIPSIAFQMISSIPSTRSYVLQSVNHPQLFHLSICEQVDRLVTKPLLEARVSESKAKPMLILVDGLDECVEREERSQFLHAMTEIVSAANFPLAFLCTSRPESDIRGVFNGHRALNLSTRLVLDDKFQPSLDIQRFLEHHFAEIKSSHPLKEHIPPTWPSTDDLHKLVAKSSGQFIYASTVMKQVASHRHIPMEQLKIILNLRPGSPAHASPFKELDALYHQILLSSIPDHDLAIVIRILGIVCLSKSPMNPCEAESIFGLLPGQSLLYLQDLHSLIDVRGYQDVIQPFHASLGDFLADRSRSEVYHVDMAILGSDELLIKFKHTLQRIQSRKELGLPVYNEAINRPQVAIPLTNELLQFFVEFSWQNLKPKGRVTHVTPNTLAQRGVGDLLGRSMQYAFDTYKFCAWAAEISPEQWTAIHKRAFREVSLWIRKAIAGMPLPDALNASATDSWEFQQRNKAWAWRLYARSFATPVFQYFNWHDSRRTVATFFAHTRVMLRHQEVSDAFYISNKEHDYLVYNTILTSIVHGILSSDRYSGNPGLNTLDRPSILNFVEIATVFGRTGRTSYLDALVPHLESEINWIRKNRQARYMMPRDEVVLYPIRRNSKCIQDLRRSISRYKEKPKPDDYDEEFKLHGEIHFGMRNPPYLLMSSAGTKNPSQVFLNEEATRMQPSHITGGKSLRKCRGNPLEKVRNR